MNKTVFMITFSFLNQTLWCDSHWNRLSETIPMSGNIIGFGWEIGKLTFWKLSILDLICCPVEGIHFESQHTVSLSNVEHIWKVAILVIWWKHLQLRASTQLSEHIHSDIVLWNSEEKKLFHIKGFSFITLVASESKCNMLWWEFGLIEWPYSQWRF